MNRMHWLAGLSVLLAASLACNVLTSRDRSSVTPGGTPGSSPVTNSDNTKWPMPENVVNFTDMGNGSVNFQVKMSLKDTEDFYRSAFEKQGLDERTELTAVTASTFSMVFDGDPSGQAVVIQAVDLGNGMTNVNIRYEKI